MTHIERHLADEDINALAMALGGQFPAVYAEGIDVSGTACVSPYVVFRLPGANNGRCLVIESDWSDTPEDYLDYHVMRASIEERARNIPWSTEHGEPGVIGWPHSSFSLAPFIVVQEIEVLSCSERSDSDSVSYDAALILKGVDGREFVIAAHESIRGGVEYTLDSHVIAELRDRFTLRHTVKAGG